MHYLKSITLLLLIVCIGTRLDAMDSDNDTQKNDTPLINLSESDFDGFATIDRQVLKRIVNFQPPSSWKIGQLHSSFLLFPIFGGNFNAAALLSIDGERDFRDYMPPLNLASFINKSLPQANNKIIAHTREELSSAELLNMIRSSIRAGKSLAVYAIDDDKLSLITIFGVNKNAVRPEVLAIRGFSIRQKPQKIALADVVAMMDLSAWIGQLQATVNYISIMQPQSTILPTATQFLRQLKPFTIIMHEESPREEVQHYEPRGYWPCNLF